MSIFEDLFTYHPNRIESGQREWMKGIIADVHPSVKIGKNSFVWSFAIICENVVIGDNCVVGSGAYIGKNCKIGNNVRIQHGAFIVDHMDFPDNVFVGPCAVTTNDKYPVAGNKDYENLPPILEERCSLGANCTVLPGVKIGSKAMIGAGGVVTKDVESTDVVIGSYAKSLEKV